MDTHSSKVAQTILELKRALLDLDLDFLTKDTLDLKLGDSSCP